MALNDIKVHTGRTGGITIAQSAGCDARQFLGVIETGWMLLVSESREVMNVRQASQYLGISPDTLYRYITEGEIPAFKLGNRWKLRKTILDRWMERKMSQVVARRR